MAWVLSSVSGQNLQIRLWQRNVDDFAKGEEGVVEGLGSDLVVQPADEEGGFLAGCVGHGILNCAIVKQITRLYATQADVFLIKGVQ